MSKELNPEVERLAKMVGDLAAQVCEALNANSAVVIVNKDKGSMVCVGGPEQVANLEMAKKFRQNAEKLLKLANEMESGNITPDGDLYVGFEDGNMKKISKKTDTDYDITSFGL